MLKVNVLQRLFFKIVSIILISAALPASANGSSNIISPQQFDYQPQMPAWISICHKIGRYHVGYFTEYGALASQTVLVGDMSTGCYGRCGAGCGVDGRGSYTQECLNHDICTVFARDRRQCSSEAQAAAAGYFNAGPCF